VKTLPSCNAAAVEEVVRSMLLTVGTAKTRRPQALRQRPLIGMSGSHDKLELS